MPHEVPLVAAAPLCSKNTWSREVIDNTSEIVRCSSAPGFLGVALANFEITGQHPPELLEQRSSGRFPENNQYLGCSTFRLEQTGAVATGE